MTEKLSATDHQAWSAIKAQLLERRYNAGEIPAVDGAGVYAFFLLTPGTLAGVSIVSSGLIYLGMTDSSLDARNHFLHPHSGFSTLRRSLGALLKKELNLHARPRASGPSPTNVRNYRFGFDDDGEEQRLTKWMKEHLAYGFVVVSHDTEKVERALIAELCPPLNLTGWRNPQGQSLRALRNICAEEARHDAQLAKRRP
jgi:hypothetical protein